MLYLREVVGVGGVLAWLGGLEDEEEVGVWALCLEKWVHQAESQQEALQEKDVKRERFTSEMMSRFCIVS